VVSEAASPLYIKLRLIAALWQAPATGQQAGKRERGREGERESTTAAEGWEVFCDVDRYHSALSITNAYPLSHYSCIFVLIRVIRGKIPSTRGLAPDRRPLPAKTYPPD